PPPTSRVVGGNVADCRALLESSFPDRFELTLLDSTQASLPAPPILTRVRLAAARTTRFLGLFQQSRPDVLLIFASSGASFLEKALSAAFAGTRGVPTILSTRSGHFIDSCRASRAFRWMARRLLRIPTRLLCQGERWRQFF